MKKEYIYFSIFLLLLFIGIFYWFQIRPAGIRKKCADPYYSLELISSKEGANKSKEEIKANLKGEGLTSNLRNMLYRNCLVYHGLKAEDLFN